MLSCNKENPTVDTKSSMSFKVNGAVYQFDEFKFIGGSPAAGNFRIRSAVNFGTSIGVPTDFPYWFDIRKSSTGAICAALMPNNFPLPYIDSLGLCNFQIPAVDMNGAPLSAQSVYYYESGTISFSKSNCASKDYFDINCLCTLMAQMCDLNGDFSLTFRNGLNQTMTLTEGKFFIKNVFQ